MPATDITAAAATAAEYRLEHNKDDESEDGIIETDLLGVTRYISRRLGQTFGKDAADVARLFYIPRLGDARTWYFDDITLVSLTELKTDENGDDTVDTVWTEDTDFRCWPLNAPLGAEPEPYTGLHIPLHANTSLWWTANKLVKVTGIWGWPAVPEPIKRGVIHLTAILRLETPRAKREVSPMGEVLGASPVAQSIIYDLIRDYGRIGV